MNKYIRVISLIISLLLGKAYAQDEGTITIEHVNVIPMNEEIILKDHRVRIANGKIIKVEPDSVISEFESDITIDGRGKYLIPGLSEMHYHYRNNDRSIGTDFKLLIANGITTARNLGEYEGQDHIAIRNSVRSGEILGPNYYTTGPYLQAHKLKTIEDVITVTRQHAERGYDYLKIGDGDNIPKNIYLKLLEEAHKNNITVIGHGQHNLPLEYSLRMKSIEHVEEFVYIFQDGQNYNDLKHDLEFLNNAAVQIKNSGVYVAPTLVVFETLTQYLNDQKFAELKKIDEVKYLPATDAAEWLTEENHYRKDFKNRKLNGVEASILFDKYFIWMKKFTKILADHKIPLMTGSDTFGVAIVGFSLHRELELLNEVGLTPYQALLASTVTSARYLDNLAFEGTISEGKNANLVLLNKNPLENISHTKTIEGVMLHGSWFNRQKLDEMLKEVELSDQ